MSAIASGFRSCFALCAVFFAACVYLIVERYRLRKNIRRISEAAETVASGQLAPIPKTSSGELARLSLSLNLLSERFQYDLAEMKRLEEIRKEFVANVSHELRTPISTIRAFAETLLEGALQDEERALEFVKEISLSSERMEKLVEDILQISALESGKMPPRFETASLMKIASEVVASLIPFAQQKQVVLRIEPFGDLSEVHADREQMRRVFINLIENAIKYTPERGCVRVFALSDEGSVRVMIEDNGIGISPEDLPRIFERFYRADKARSREMGGTGLGLSIVKRIVELHGGSVGVESALGKGTKFFFKIPALIS